MSKGTRTLKSPAEKAQAALGVEQRRVDKLTEKRKALNVELQANGAELAAAEKRLAYLKANPDLPVNHTQPLPIEVDGEPATGGAEPVEQPKTPKPRRAVADNPQA